MKNLEEQQKFLEAGIKFFTFYTFEIFNKVNINPNKIGIPWNFLLEDSIELIKNTDPYLIIDMANKFDVNKLQGSKMNNEEEK